MKSNYLETILIYIVLPFIINTLIMLSPVSVGSQESKGCPSVHTGPIAIFIDPTEDELDGMKKENGEEDFYTIADDNIYYNYEAAKYFEKMNVPYCHTKNEKHTFITGDYKKFKLKDECNYWCLIIWNGRDKPVYASPADIFMYESYLKGSK